VELPIGDHLGTTRPARERTNHTSVRHPHASCIRFDQRRCLPLRPGGQGVAGSNPVVPTVIEPGQGLACFGVWVLVAVWWSPTSRVLALLTVGLARYCSSSGAPREERTRSACGCVSDDPVHRDVS
jgi:hypothetical protein